MRLAHRRNETVLLTPKPGDRITLDGFCKTESFGLPLMFSGILTGPAILTAQVNCGLLRNPRIGGKHALQRCFLDGLRLFFL